MKTSQRTISVFCLLALLALPRSVRADGETEQEKALLAIMEKGKARAAEQIKQLERKQTTGESSTGAERSAGAKPAVEARLPFEDDVVDRLSRQVVSLKQKDALQKEQAAATEHPKDVKRVGTKTVFNYKEGALYEVHTGVDRITDIELQVGETLTSPPVSGDTVRWKVSLLQSGKGVRSQTHIILKPLETDIETNFILTTDKHIYHLKALAGDWYIPSVSWNYPLEESPEYQQMATKEKSEEAVVVAPDKLHFDYFLDGRSYAWKPVRVFDDGAKTYIQMPQEMKVNEAPVLFILDEDKENPVLVNYRVKGEYYVVDRLFEKAELRVGPNKTVTIDKEDHRSFFEKLF